MRQPRMKGSRSRLRVRSDEGFCVSVAAGSYHFNEEKQPFYFFGVMPLRRIPCKQHGVVIFLSLVEKLILSEAPNFILHASLDRTLTSTRPLHEPPPCVCDWHEYSPAVDALIFYLHSHNNNERQTTSRKTRPIAGSLLSNLFRLDFPRRTPYPCPRSISPPFFPLPVHADAVRRCEVGAGVEGVQGRVQER